MTGSNWTRRKLFSKAACTGLVVAGLVIGSCGGGGGSPSPPTSPPASALDYFDSIWADFDLNYSFFVLKSVDWNESRTRFRSQLSSTSTDRELFDTVAAMFLELKDAHVTLDAPLGTSAYTGWYDQYPTNFDESIITATYLGQSAMMSPQVNMLFGRIDTDIGYVRLHTLSGVGHGDDMDFVLSQMTGINALVVDLRSNGGGDDRNGKAVAARFADTSRLFRTVRFRDGPGHGDLGPPIDDFVSPDGAQSFAGPVAVLTNRSTISSAESTVLAFAALPNTTLVGDFTGGGSANPVQRTLGNGWRYTVSRWIEFRPDGSTFEGVGIEPDVRVDISAGDAAALRDTILDTAVSVIQSKINP